MRFDVGRAPGNGAMLTTAGGLVFHGDMSRRFRAFDVNTGQKLWEVILGGNISVSTITYAVNGKQYVCVMTGFNLKVPELSAEVPEHAHADACTMRSTCLRFRNRQDASTSDLYNVNVMMRTQTLWFEDVGSAERVRFNHENQSTKIALSDRGCLPPSLAGIWRRSAGRQEEKDRAQSVRTSEKVEVRKS